MKNELFEYVQRMQALAKTGLSYANDPYDRERYEEIRDRSNRLLGNWTGLGQAAFDKQFAQLDDDYATPKVDVRGWLVQGDQVLLVQEQSDDRWALPGGWCDIGFTPAENIRKEVQEETGLQVTVTHLMAVWDKRRHNEPPGIRSVYKLFFYCQPDGGHLEPGHDVRDARFFPIQSLPELSTMRTTAAQIAELAKWNPTSGVALFDR